MATITQDRNNGAAHPERRADHTYWGGDDPRIDALVALCRGALTGDCQGLAPAIKNIGRPEDFAMLVDQARLWSACEAGFACSPIAAPAFVTRQAQAARAQAMLINSRVMGLARIAFPCLDRHAIPAIAFKGPFHQRQLHGDWFIRRSNDLDLLVPADRFEDALAALEADRFRMREGTSQWWKMSLGEVHLDYPGGGVIDLHHRLQQPGCPAPRNLSDFIDMADVERLGEAAIPIPSLGHALLISALNFCKELFHRKPSARYAYDFAAGIMRLSPEAQREFAALVERQGLEGPVGFALAACEQLFGPLPGLDQGPARRVVRAHWAEPARLARLVFTPDAEGLRWPRRRSLLWQFCGGEASARCSLDFAAQTGRIALGEVLRHAAPETSRQPAT